MASASVHLRPPNLRARKAPADGVESISDSGWWWWWRAGEAKVEEAVGVGAVVPHRVLELLVRTS
jgi:hypothetical protein